MKKIIIALAIEIILVPGLLAFHGNSKVLGLSLIAQNDTTSTPVDTPTDTSNPPDTTSQTPSDTPAPSSTSAPQTPSVTPADSVPVDSTPEPNVFLQTPAPSETPTPSDETAGPTDTPKVSPSPTSSELVSSGVFSDQGSVVDNQSLSEAEHEDKVLSLATTPENEVILLTGFAQDKVNDIGNFLKVNDQASVVFATQRLDSQLSWAIDNLSKVAPQNRTKTTASVNSLCVNVESALRAHETAVSEDTEADLEIIRAKCLGMHL